MIRFIPCNKQKVQIMEEWKIGEIRQIDNEWYQCLESSSCRCDYCDYGELGDCHKIACASGERSDDKEVYFKKLKKVGKPYEHYEKLYQCYKLPMETEIRLLPNNCYPIGKDNLVEIEIKQKEDMEEKKIKLSQDDIDWLKKQIRWAALPGYITHEENYDRATEEIMNLFIPSDTEHSSSEKIGKNLKPFDLETAKAGKPVCTRDGRKARIICLDFQSIENTPIVAVVQVTDKQEVIANYYEDGQQFVDGISELDLMMLPEKKEGWINIYNADTTFYYVDGRVFDTKDEAVKEAKEEVEKEQREKNEYIDTIRVEWEE